MRDRLCRALAFDNDLEAPGYNMLSQPDVRPHSATGRARSRGAHACADLPGPDDAWWRKRGLAFRAGGLRLVHRPAHPHRLPHEVGHIPLQKRVH